MNLYEQLKGLERFPKEFPLQTAEWIADYANGSRTCHKEFIDFLKSVGVDEEKVYKFLRSIDGCNTEWIDSDWADAVNLPELASSLTKQNIIGDIERKDKDG